MLAVVGCSKSTRTDTAATDATTTSTSADYTATGNATAATSDSLRTSTDRVANDMQSAANSAGSAIGAAASNVATSARVMEWKLSANDIQADLAANREIVRTKDAAGAPTGNIDKSQLESLVEGRLQADTEIASLKLDVDADRNGAVKLSGKAMSAEQVGRAIALALDTEGVTKVSSKVKLDKDANR